MAVALLLRARNGSRSNKSQLTDEDMEKFGELVETVLPPEVSHSQNSRVIFNLALRHESRSKIWIAPQDFVRVPYHRAKFQIIVHSAVTSDIFLPVKNRST